MNFKTKNIATAIFAVILIATILTLNIPLLIYSNCSNMDESSCTCNKAGEQKSCCEKDSQIKLTIGSSNHCGCFITEANHNADFYKNQIALLNKLNAFEKSLYEISFTYHNNFTSVLQTNIHSPPLISNSPLYISIHSLLI